MAIFKGKNLKIEIYGESHSEKIGAKVEGMPVFTFSSQKLTEFLNRRKPSGGVFSTKRKEADEPIFTGINGNKTANSFSVDILNTNTKSQDYNDLLGKPRPSHADYASFLKDGTLDFTGGGRFSGRLTAPMCVVGGLLKQYLEQKGIKVHAYISQIGSVYGKSYKNSEINEQELLNLQGEEFPTLSNKSEMLEEIKNAKQNLDSVGGVIECIVYNMKTGVGDNLFEGLEGKISSLIYSVPAVKGVEFGAGFSFSSMLGSVANDCLRYNGENIEFLSNNNGGINGGISNGEKITIRVAIKPTPSISKPQNTVDLINKTNAKIEIRGRHDACIVPRAVPCIESAVCIALADELGDLL